MVCKIDPHSGSIDKHASNDDKIAFLVYLQYVHCAEAARQAGFCKSTTTNIKNHAGYIQIEYAKQGLPLSTLQEQVTRKPGSRAKPKISIDQVTYLLEACTLNKRQRKKLWHIVAKEGFFDLHCCTIEKKLRERGLKHVKSTKKPGLTDIQKAQQLEIALLQQHWGLAE